MAHRDELERYEATEAQDLTRLLCTVRPPARAVQVPPDVDLTIRAAIWKTSVRRQVTTLLAMARRDLIQVIRQALAENPLLEAVSGAEDEDRSTCEENAQGLTEAAGDLTDAAERYASLWLACVPDARDADELPSQASEASGASERPGGSPEALVPDMIVTQVGHDYQVVLNEDGMPRLRLRATSRRLGPAGHGGAPEATQDLDDKLRAAVWLLRSLEHRRQTLLQVAIGLVTRQRDWLDHGLAYVKPLALTEVANTLGLHASTVRLVLANKYLSTADGIIALTAFFPHGVESSAGEPQAAVTVHQPPQRLVADVHTPSQPVWLPGSRRSPLFCAACGTPRPNPWSGVPCQACGSVDPTQVVQTGMVEERDTIGEPRAPLTVHEPQQRMTAKAGTHPQPAWPPGTRLAPDEEERVHEILENPANLPFRQAWLHNRPTVPDSVGEMRQAFHDLQTALAHPQLRPAVLLALRAFAQAAQASAITPSPADPVEPGPHLTEPPRLGEREEASGVPPEVEAAQRHHDLAWLERCQQSPKMREVVRLLERVLPTTATVLLTGERGTGKRYLARLLHHQGPRAEGPYMTVNCAALPETLLEAELFGAERGAFTDTTQRQPGHIELAAGGTLLLEEIDALSPALQAKLLRVLQAKQFERVGGTEPLTTDVRIITATHQDLARLVAEGRFRHDLYYRFNVYPIALPPLRERREDLGPLTMFLLKGFSQKLRKEVVGISKEALGLLERYSWPGNVRELEEVIERAVARCQGPMVTAQDLPQALREQSRAPVWSSEVIKLPPGGIAMADLEKHLIRQALDQAHGNKSQAAQKLGLSRTQLRVRMRQYGLEDD